MGPTQGGMTTAPDAWHAEQDRVIDESIVRAEEGLDGPNAAMRTWWWSAHELFYNAHLVNVVAVRRRSESFRALDLGCGTGALTSRLAAMYPNAEFTGIDSNELSITQARSAGHPPNVVFELGRFENCTEMGRFDLVICSEVFEHVADTDRLLETIASLLEPGGYMSFSTPSGWMHRRIGPLLAYRWLHTDRARYRRVMLEPERNWREALPHHPAIQPSRLRAMLAAHGLDVVSRGSSLWLLEERRGFYVPLLRRLSHRMPRQAARAFFYGYVLLEALMNLLPPLRIFESRQVLLAQRSTFTR